MKLPGEPCESVSLNASCLRLRRDLQVTPIIVGYSKHLQYFFSPSTSVKYKQLLLHIFYPFCFTANQLLHDKTLDPFRGRARHIRKQTLQRTVTLHTSAEGSERMENPSVAEKCLFQTSAI